jgi:pyruvate dehydrogenase E1 component alpha subunit
MSQQRTGPEFERSSIAATLGSDGDELVELYRSMVRLRVYDERAVLSHRQGRIGTYAIQWGHEAIQAGAVHALGPDDWIFPSYRESAVGLLRGMPPATVFAWWRGHPDGWWDPYEYRIAPLCVPVATQIPHAVGMAWGMKLKGEEACALVLFGDGATSKGDFHEGLSFASALQVPVVFLCNNNSWAISTPVEAQSAAKRLSDKGVGYGIPSVQVDGTDVVAVRDAVRTAARRARAGGGPTLVEAVTERAAPHATADDPSLYADPQRLEAAREAECVKRLDGRLKEEAVLDQAAREEIWKEADAEMRTGIELAERLPKPDPALVFDVTYAEPIPSVLEARADHLGT